MTVTLEDAINVIQMGDLEKGRALLAKVLQQDPNNEAAWIWMSGTVEDVEQRRYCLEKALEINPANPSALAGLSRLGSQPPPAVPPTPLARQDRGVGQPPADEPPATNAPTPAFIWTEGGESEEELSIVEETFIGDIVAAMNKDEPDTPPAQDTDLHWLFQSPEEMNASAQATDQELRDLFSGKDQADSSKKAREELTDDKTGLDSGIELRLVGEEIEAGSGESAFGGLEPDEIAALQAASTPTPGQLWRDPTGLTRRVTILTDRYLIASNLNPKHLNEIESLLQAGQFPRRLLGHRARIIPLDHISSLHATPDSPTLLVNYQRNKDALRQVFTLSSIEQRNEVVEAFKARLGAQFQATTHKTNLWDALAVPGITLIILALITGLLYFWAMDLLINPAALAKWLPASWTTWLSGDAALNLPLYVVLIGGGLLLLVMIWLVLTLRKPTRALILTRKPEETNPG